MPHSDFPHPLPRRHGTGIPALAQIAEGRARGWRAVARTLGPLDDAARQWALERSLDDWDAALGWRQGEEHIAGASLAGLHAWLRVAEKRGADAGWAKCSRVWLPHGELAREAARLADVTKREADAWNTRKVAEARTLRSECAPAIGAFADRVSAALGSGPVPRPEEAEQTAAPASPPANVPAPYRFFVNLTLIFIRAESGTPTLRHMS